MKDKKLKDGEENGFIAVFVKCPICKKDVLCMGDHPETHDKECLMKFKEENEMHIAHCKKCNQMTNHNRKNECLKCKKDKLDIIDQIEKEEILKFFKDAFCVDGETKIIFTDYKEFKIISAVELNDSLRGKFYIGVLKYGK